MNRFTLVLIALIVAAGSVWTPRTALAEKAVCLVCKVKEGATSQEPVKATRTYDGVRYGFCSEKCAKEFDTDPIAYLPPRLPRPSPEMSLSDLQGNALGPSLHGKVVLVDFWATWCAPCQKSMPELQALHVKYAPRGFTVVGVSIDKDADAKVRKVVEKRKITYPIAIDSEQSPVWEKYRVKGVPAAFLIDREGRIVAQWTGVAPKASEIEKELVALLGRSS